MADYMYLHKNGELIFKKNYEPEDFDSPFVRRVWRVIPDRACAWQIALESLALGGNLDRVKEFCKGAKLTKEDFLNWNKRVTDKTPLEKKGMRLFFKDIVGKDMDEYLAWAKKVRAGEDDE